MFFRYLVIGFYVGMVTVGGYAWWYLWNEHGPQMTWREFTHFDSCVEGEHAYSCKVFHDRRCVLCQADSVLTTSMMSWQAAFVGSSYWVHANNVFYR